MRPNTFSLVTATTPKVVPLDYHLPYVMVQATVTGTVSYTVSYTTENIYEITAPETNANWVAVTNMTAATATAAQKVDAPVFALKYVLNSGSGSVSITCSQPDA